MKSVTTILFVENDAVALTMYQKRLQREGFHVEVAEDGIAALRVLSEMTPDIVILDLMLPKFSGKDVFDYMRADAQFKNVPVIIFSNAPRTEWPQNPEDSPTRALPKSEANFSSLLELIKEMTTAAPAPAVKPAKSAAAPATKSAPAIKSAAVNAAAAAPQVEPDIFVKAPSAPSTATETAPADDLTSVETLEQFLEYANADMAVIREHCLAFIKAPNTDPGRKNLAALRQRLQALDIGAQKIRCARLALLAGAWESLLGEIEKKPSIASPSVLQTLAQAADCLRILLAGDRTTAMAPLPKARVLSVDDDEICNHVAVSALERSNMNADSVQDATAALDLVKQHDYDLVLLDINMPGLTGFELCEKIRALPEHQKTPVIFVTAFNNFENRKQSVLSGGGDLIAKPVTPLELALKVSIHLLKAPLKPVTAATAETKPEGALVWKEPVETISHESELHLDSAANTGRTPNVVMSTTQTRTTEPDPAEVAAAAPPLKIKSEPAPASASAAPAIPGPSLKIKAEPTPAETPATALKLKAEPAKPEAPASTGVSPASSAPALNLKMKAEPAKAPAAPIKPPVATPPTPPPAKPPAPPADPKPILESVAQSRPLPEKGKVAPTQPPRTSQPAASPSNGSSKPKQNMNKENNQQFETLVLDVAHIIFGDNAPEINVRLVRMAMEQVWQNRANLESIDSIAREIARIIFGENATSDLNIRLVRMALERSNSIALFKAA
jgi:DNA-binding response OmpR family regulator